MNLLGGFLGYVFFLFLGFWIASGFSFAELSETLKSKASLAMVLFVLALVLGYCGELAGKLKALEKRLPPEEPAEQDAPEEEQDAAKEE